MSIPISFKRGSSAALSGVNPLFLAGELVYEIDTLKVKIGDGTSLYNDLPFIFSGVYLQNLVEDSSPALGNNLNINNFNIFGTGNIDISGDIAADSGNFTSLFVNNTEVALSGHNHTSSQITDFGNSVSGLLPANIVNGSGVENYISKWVDGDTLSTGIIYDNGNNIGIGTSFPLAKLHIINPNTFQNPNVIIHDSASLASGVGASIILGGKFNTAGSYGDFAEIKSIKESSANNNASASLAFSTTNIADMNERMRITSSGNVGIGTTSPSSKLDVSGVITATSGNSTNWNAAYSWGDHSASGYLTDITSENIEDLNNVIRDFSYPILNEYTLIYDSGISAFKGSTINLGLIKQGTIPLAGYSSSYLGYYIRMNNGEFTVNEQGDNLNFRVEGNTVQNLFFTDAIADSVGIGTNAPAAPLHLVRPKNDIYGSVLIQDSTSTTSNVGGSIVLGGRYTSGEDYARFGQIAALKQNSTDGDAKSVLSFSTNDGSAFAERMRILPSGNVAIGTAGSDSHRFSVRGNINANNAIGIFSDTNYGSAATSGTVFNNYSRGGIGDYAIQNFYHFYTSSPTMLGGSLPPGYVNNELCYSAIGNLAPVSQRGFYSTINGASSWQLYMGGTARSYIEGNLGLGTSNPINKLQVENGSVVFNSAAGNYDFTVGGDTDIHTLCVDASADSVGIGLNTPLSTLHIEKNGVASLRLQRSAAVGTAAVPVERSHIVFSNYNNAYDHIKLISWGRENNFLAGMLGVNISNSTGVSSEVLTIDNQSSADTFGLRTYNIPLVTTSGNVIFNETGGNFDFRVEGDSDPNLLFVDASTDRIGIGRSNPEYLLDIGSDAGSSIMRVNTIQLRNYVNITNGDNASSRSSIMGPMYSPLGIGYGTAPTTDRSITYATNYFSNPGDAQKISMVVQHETTNNTPAYLNAAKTGGYLYSTYVRNDTFLMPINSSSTFTMHIVANNNTDGTSAGWIVKGCVKSVDRSLSLVGTPTIENFADAGMSSASINIETQNGSGISSVRMGGLLVKVTGISGKTIRWVCTIDAVITSF